MTGRSLVGSMLLCLTAGSLLADDPQLPDVKTYDKIVVDSLRDIHNEGADLFNKSKDAVGAFRLYQGALLTVKPLLAHRPAAQKLIVDGLAEAEKLVTQQQKAFKLHETIEEVRDLLKKGGEPKAKTEETKKSDNKKSAPMNDTKPAPVYELAPQPREKKVSDESNKSKSNG